MPTPLQLISDPIAVSLFALYALLLLWEAFAPARRLPYIPGWKSRGLLAFTLYFFLSSYLPLWWAEALADWQLFDLSGLETWGGAVMGILLYEACVYVWHRAMHTSDLLWRVSHQMHHSAERLDAYGAFWFSPMDMIGWTLLFSVCMSLVGLSPEAVTLALLSTSFMSIFQHSNIRTPQWLGYFIQRPESHSIHHARGHHAGNYSDLPLFDMVFGTFHNPKNFADEAGFYDGASHRLADMLLFRDVSKSHF